MDTENTTSFLLFFQSRILLNCDEVFRNFRPTKNFGVLCCGKQLSALLMKLHTCWFEQQGAEGYQNVFANSMIQGKQMERKCLPLCERARDPCFYFFAPHLSVFVFLFLFSGHLNKRNTLNARSVFSINSSNIHLHWRYKKTTKRKIIRFGLQ